MAFGGVKMALLRSELIVGMLTCFDGFGDGHAVGDEVIGIVGHPAPLVGVVRLIIGWEPGEEVLVVLGRLRWFGWSGFGVAVAPGTHGGFPVFHGSAVGEFPSLLGIVVPPSLGGEAVALFIDVGLELIE
jgi:hypothetical protein